MMKCPKCGGPKGPELKICNCDLIDPTRGSNMKELEELKEAVINMSPTYLFDGHTLVDMGEDHIKGRVLAKIAEIERRKKLGGEREE